MRSPGIAISKYDVFGRLQRLEDTMFTKENAKEMRAETKAEMQEMRAETKADMQEMRAAMELRMNWMFAISTLISLLNPLIGAYNTFMKNKLLVVLSVYGTAASNSN